MSEVSIRVSVGGHALIYLDHMDARPRDIFAGEGTEHKSLLQNDPLRKS